MRSADLKAGLIRVAKFGRGQSLSEAGAAAVDVDSTAAVEGPRASQWRLVVAGCVTLVLLLMGAWYAGRESAGLEVQRASVQLNQLAQQVAANELALNQEKARAEQLEKALHTSGKTPGLALETQLRQQLLQAQAQANQYKAIIDRERQEAAENSRLIAALANPGARLVSLKGAEAAADSTAYALVVENSNVVFVASNLPAVADGRQYQVWLVRKQDPKTVSAGVFTPDASGHATVAYDNGTVVSDISLIEVTDEPEGGSETPSGTKLLESGTGEPAHTGTDADGR